MTTVAFERTRSTVAILDPGLGFAERRCEVEVRRDPLLGDTSVHNPTLRAKSGFFGENDEALVARLVAESAGSCIFCGDRLREATARYPEALLPGGRIAVGEATLLPNLFAQGAHHPVVVISRAHFLRLDEFAPALLADALAAGRAFLREVARRDPAAAFASVNANYLFPAGASVVHPHLQLLATPLPYSWHARLLAAARAHRERHGTLYHDDLVLEERRLGERLVARTGDWDWIAAFSPIGSNEIQAVHAGAGDVAALTDGDLRDLAAGLSRVLAFHGSRGHLSFNWSLLGAAGEAGAAARCTLRVVTRQNLCPNYRNDDYFLQKLLQTELIATLPEELAGDARAFFASA